MEGKPLNLNELEGRCDDESILSCTIRIEWPSTMKRGRRREGKGRRKEALGPKVKIVIRKWESLAVILMKEKWPATAVGIEVEIVLRGLFLGLSNSN